MRNIWLVIKHDTGVTLKQRSFWVLTLLMPTLMLALNAYAVIKDNDLGSASGSASSEQGEPIESPTGLPSIGLVDQAGLIEEIPADILPDLFVRFRDQTAAKAALRSGRIEQYVLIPAGFVTDGQVTVYDHNFRISLSGQDMGVAFNSTNEWVLTYLINYSLSGGDENLVTALRNPTPGGLAERHVLNPPVKANESDQALVEVVYRLMPFVYYFLLIMGSNYLMRSVIAEKENRTAEVLMLSLPPRQLMVGKILAMSFVVLIQLAF
jgi:ABC-2 type transport system permease protein